jgi:hypothetical protein
MTMLPRLVLPAVATLGVMYPASFLVGMWKSAESGDLEAPGALVSAGELSAGWRYEVFERHFPKTYRIDMSAADQGYGSLCILEVRGGPQPVQASAGPGTLVYVTLERPLPGFSTSRVSIDIAEAMRARCAGVVSDGQLYAGGAAGPVNQAAMTGAREQAVYTKAPVRESDAMLRQSLTPVSLEPTAMGM